MLLLQVPGYNGRRGEVGLPTPRYSRANPRGGQRRLPSKNSRKTTRRKVREKTQTRSPERDLRFDYTSQCCDVYRKLWWRSATWGDPQKLHCRPTNYVSCMSCSSVIGVVPGCPGRCGSPSLYLAIQRGIRKIKVAQWNVGRPPKIKGFPHHSTAA